MDGYQKVSQKDLQHVLKVHGLITFHKQANVLFTRFDKDKDGMIDFLDFKYEIQPLMAQNQRNAWKR